MDPDQTNCFVLSDLGISADDISEEGKELTKCEPDKLSFLWSVDQIRYHIMYCLYLQFAKSLDQDLRSNLFVWPGLIWFQPVC